MSKVTREEVKRYIDNIPRYRLRDELDEMLGQKTNPYTEEIIKHLDTISSLEQRIEELEDEIEGYSD